MKFELNDNTGITCNSEELAEILQAKFQELPECEDTLRSGISWVDTWKKCEEKTVFFPYDGTYDSIYDVENGGYTIIDGEEWLRSFDEPELNRLITKEQRQKIIDNGKYLKIVKSEFDNHCHFLSSNRVNKPVISLNNFIEAVNKIIEKLSTLQPEPKEEPKQKEYMTPLQAVRFGNSNKNILLRRKNTSRMFMFGNTDCVNDMPVEDLEQAENIPENEINNGTELTNWREFLVEYL